MTTAPDSHRPAGVTLISVLIWIAGILNIIAGIILIFARNDTDIERELGAGSNTVLTLGIITLVIGLIILGVSGGLRRGSSFARMLVSLLLVLELVGAIYVIVEIPGNNTAALVNGGISLVALLLLWGPQANRFFHSR